MNKILTIFSIAVVLAPLAMSIKPYNRCDDICRVLGYEYGECRFVTSSEQHCFCQEGDSDASWVLPNACENT